MRDKILLTIAAISGGTGMTITNIDLMLAVLLKFTSLITFVCFILINQDKIEEGFCRFLKRFKG